MWTIADVCELRGFEYGCVVPEGTHCSLIMWSEIGS